MEGKFFLDLSLLLVLTCKVTSGNICASRPTILPTNNSSIDHELFGNISSPNYPNNYPDGTTKTWKIVAPVGHVIDLYFTAFALETSSSCKHDYVKIRNRCDDIVPMATYCDRKPRPLRSSSNVLWVEFRSDESNNDRGFRAVYIINSNSSKPPSCPRPSDNIANIDYCPRLNTNMSKMEVHCCNEGFSSCNVNKILAANTGGTITSPGYPGNYPPGKEYVWRITAPDGYVVQINFTTLVTHQTTLCYDSKTQCKCDYVHVLDGACRYDVGPQWCGAWTSEHKYPSFITTGRHMLVIFKSDWFNNNGGFVAQYRKALYCKDDKPISCVTNGNPSCCPRDATVCVSGNSTRSHCPRDGDPANYTGCCNVNGSPSCCPVKQSLNCPRPSDDQTFIDICHNGSQAACCNKNLPACKYNKLLTDKSGTITSPDYPSKYPDNQFFIWRITAPWGYVVQIDFTKFKIASGSRCPRCSCDYIGVIDGPCSNYAETTWCESEPEKLPSFVSTGRHLQVLFKSDESLNNEGFVAKYKRVLALKCGGDKPVLCTDGYGQPSCCSKVQESGSTKHCLHMITIVTMATALLALQ